MISWSRMTGRFLGVSIIVLTIVTAVAFYIQSRQTSEATKCQSALLKAVVARALANEDERMALRELIRARVEDPSSGYNVKQRYLEYQEVIKRSDLARTTDGRLDNLTRNCQNN